MIKTEIENDFLPLHESLPNCYLNTCTMVRSCPLPDKDKTLFTSRNTAQKIVIPISALFQNPSESFPIIESYIGRQGFLKSFSNIIKEQTNISYIFDDDKAFNNSNEMHDWYSVNHSADTISFLFSFEEKVNPEPSSQIDRTFLRRISERFQARAVVYQSLCGNSDFVVLMPSLEHREDVVSQNLMEIADLIANLPNGGYASKSFRMPRSKGEHFFILTAAGNSEGYEFIS